MNSTQSRRPLLGLLGIAIGLGLLVAILRFASAPLVLKEKGVPLPLEDARVAHREIGEITAASNLRDGKLGSLRPQSGLAKEYLALLRKIDKTNQVFYEGFDLMDFRLLDRLVSSSGRKQSRLEIGRARRALAWFGKSYEQEEKELRDWYERATGESDPESWELNNQLRVKWVRLATDVLDKAAALIDYCDRHWPVRYLDSFTFEDASQVGVFEDLSKEFDQAWANWDRANLEIDGLAQLHLRGWLLFAP